MTISDCNDVFPDLAAKAAANVSHSMQEATQQERFTSHC